MNPFSWKLASSLLATLLVAIGLQKPVVKPEEIVSELDAHYQARFLDLSGIERGMFGRSRIEASSIKKHGGYQAQFPRINESYWYAIQLFGNEGKPLRFGDLQNRLHLSYWRTPESLETERGRRWQKLEAFDLTLKEAIARFSDPKAKPIVVMRDAVRWELRPVRLSKKECLSCHGDSKLGDPIAVMAYGTAPMRKSPGKSQR